MGFNRMSCTPKCFCILHHWVSKGSNLVKKRWYFSTYLGLWYFSRLVQSVNIRMKGNGIPRSTSSSKCSWLRWKREGERETHHEWWTDISSCVPTALWQRAWCLKLFLCRFGHATQQSLFTLGRCANMSWTLIHINPDLDLTCWSGFLVLCLYTCQNSADTKQL